MLEKDLREVSREVDESIRHVCIRLGISLGASGRNMDVNIKYVDVMWMMDMNEKIKEDKVIKEQKKKYNARDIGLDIEEYNRLKWW